MASTASHPPEAAAAQSAAGMPWQRARRWLRRGTNPVFSGSGFESTRYLTRWLFLSTAIGIVAGLGAIVFFLGISWATDFFLGQLVGYLPPSPVGEGTVGIHSGMARPWLLPLVVALGGLISGVIVFNLAPEAEGHGTDAAIDAIHHKRGLIRARIPPIKLIASAITIGSGGSGGREGPAAQISAGFGSLMGQWLNLSVQDRRIAVAAGMGAGIGAIFRAPLGGAVLAAEILYLHDLEVEALIPGLIASIVGYTIYGSVFGFSPIFGAQPDLALDAPVQLLYYGILGVVAGLGGLLYARTFYGVTALFHHLRLPRWLKPAIGGLLVGLMGLVIPGSLHMGYGWVQASMDAPTLLGLPLWMVLLLPFAKILATSLSIGSGGSGGIFGPGMVIGGVLGASCWVLFRAFLPNVPASPASFVIIGMMALFGGVAHAPLAVMLMVAEMTGNLSLLAPAMIAVGVSTALIGNETIYRSQLPNRASSPAHRVHFSFPLLSTLLVRDAMRPPTPMLQPEQTLAQAEHVFAEYAVQYLSVVDAQRRLLGVLARSDLDGVPAAERPNVTVQAKLTPAPIDLGPDQPLDEALAAVADSGRPWAPVVERGQLLGRLGARDVIAAYKATLQRSIRRARNLPEGTALFEVRLAADAPLAGHTLRDAGLPPGTLVVSISRDGETLFPQASTQLLSGDTLLVVADPAREPALRQAVEHAAAEGAASGGRDEG